MSLDALSVGLIIPVVPSLVKTLAGADQALASRALSIMLAVFATAQLFAGPILGGLSDRFGRRRVILISIAGMAFDFVLSAMAPNLGWLFFARAGAGLTAASVVTVNAYIADVTPPELRAQRFGLIGAVIGSSFVLGPFVGGELGQFGPRVPFWVAAGLCGLNFLYGLLVLPESLPPERRRRFEWRRANPFGSLTMIRASGDLSRLSTGWFLVWFGMSAFPVAFLYSTNLRFGWNTVQNGEAIAVYGLTQALVQAFLARSVVRAIGERSAAQLGYGFTAIAALFLCFANHGWLIWIGCVISGLGSFTMPAIRALVSSSTSSTHQGEAQGTLTVMEGLSSIAAPLITGEIFVIFSSPGHHYLPGAPFLVTAACAVTAALVFCGLSVKRAGAY